MFLSMSVTLLQLFAVVLKADSIMVSQGFQWEVSSVSRPRYLGVLRVETCGCIVSNVAS